MTEKPKNAKGWGSQLDGQADAPSPGNDSATLQKALQINPNLALQGTDDIMKQMQQASTQRTALKPEKVDVDKGARPPPANLAAGIAEYAEKYQTDINRINQEIALLQRQKAELAPKTLERVLELVVKYDANMTSPITTEVFKTHKGFLDTVGFTAKKVVDLLMKRR